MRRAAYSWIISLMTVVASCAGPTAPTPPSDKPAASLVLAKL